MEPTRQERRKKARAMAIWPIIMPDCRMQINRFCLRHVVIWQTLTYMLNFAAE